MDRFVCIVAVSLVVLAGCDPASDPLITAPVSFNFERIDEAAAFTVSEAGTAVIRDSTAWMALWEASWNVFDGTGVRTPPPVIGFSEHMVLAVFWGEGYSGCANDVEAIEDIRLDDGRIVVQVGPLPDLGPCDALVYPIDMVRLEQSNLHVVFNGEVPL